MAVCTLQSGCCTHVHSYLCESTLLIKCMPSIRTLNLTVKPKGLRLYPSNLGVYAKLCVTSRFCDLTGKFCSNRVQISACSKAEEDKCSSSPEDKIPDILPNVISECSLCMYILVDYAVLSNNLHFIRGERSTFSALNLTWIKNLDLMDLITI